MSLGNDNQQNNGKLYILKIKNKDKEGKPTPAFFEVSEKVDGKWQATSQTNRVGGNLTKIAFDKGEWNEQEYHIVKLTLNDPEKEENYLLDLRMNLLARSLYNSLLSLETFNDLSISLWQSKKEDKTYDAVSVKQLDERVNWKHSLDSLPKVEVFKVGGKKVVSTEKLDEFYLNDLANLAINVGNASKNGSGTPKVEKKKAVAKEKVEEAAPSDDSSDDIF